MCGIGAVFLRAGTHCPLEALLKRMNDSQRHRGPDGEGVWYEAGVGLAHTRLAIVDLSKAAAQPMESTDGRFVVAFNGEIYNWIELRAELEGRGVVFRTRSDTEVLIEGYRLWGEGMLARLRGMFAFVLYDRHERTALCARDPVGKKPLVYSEGAKGVAVASEIPALLALHKIGFSIDTSIDHAAIAAMLVHNLRHIPDPATAYRCIRRLPPGHAMRIEKGWITRLWRHWEPGWKHQETEEQATLERVRSVFEEAVALRCRADVPVAALLSGGVDSTAIVAQAQRVTGEPLRTYALGAGPDDEDLRRARLAAAQLGTHHREFYFDAQEGFERYRRLVSAYGEPVALLPLLHTQVLCEAMREDGIKVALAGHGADELFYGYTGHFRTAGLSRWLRHTAWLRPVARHLPGQGRIWPLALVAAPAGERKASLYEVWALRDWGRVIADDAVSDLRNLASECMRDWGRFAALEEYIDESNFLGLLVENAHSVTISSDLPAMQASVEIRAPFLDREMINLAFSLPWRDKLRDARGRPRLKHILKRVVKDLVPAPLLDAPKRGFGFDIQEERLFSGPWREAVWQALAGLGTLDGLLDRQKVERLWRQIGSVRGSAAMVSKLLSIAMWHDWVEA